MSVKALMTAIAISLSATSAFAEMKWQYSPNDQSYRDALKRYGEEMTTAKYGVKYCPDKISYNSKYFDDAPPNLWDEHRLKSFITVITANLLERLDEYHAKLDTDDFCKMLIDFARDNYPPNKMPILITEQRDHK